MKKTLLFLTCALCAATLFVSCSDDPAQPEKEKEEEKKEQEQEEEEPLATKKDGRIVLGYVTYYGSRIPDPSMMTHINYAFAELYVSNNQYNKFALQGNESRFKDVLAIKQQNADIKIMLSFSHTVSNSDNKQGGGFSALAADDANRKKFADDCLAFCEKWGIDGIDIDWEFPGLSWSGHACDPQVDVQNHVLLMKQLRETLGDKYFLSYAGYVMDMKDDGKGGKRYIDIKGVDPYVDWVNIMTYDIASGKEGQHQSAWNRPSYYYDCKRAVETYINAGIDPNKLVLGIPFYARHAWSNYKDTNGKTCYAAVSYKNFKNVYPASEGYSELWDSVGEVPYIAKNGVMWAGFDNAKSIKLKGEKIKALGMRGMMYWEYDQDNADATLRKAVWNAVMK